MESNSLLYFPILHGINKMDIETDVFCSNLFTFKPWHPTKMYYIDRDQSFEDWPQQMLQKPIDLVRNGFFYTGVGDRVTCFYCNVTLKHWDCDDCIETEHLRWGLTVSLLKWFQVKCSFEICFIMTSVVYKRQNLLTLLQNDSTQPRV